MMWSYDLRNGKATCLNCTGGFCVAKQAKTWYTLSWLKVLRLDLPLPEIIIQNRRHIVSHREAEG